MVAHKDIGVEGILVMVFIDGEELMIFIAIGIASKDFYF